PLYARAKAAREGFGTSLKSEGRGFTIRRLECAVQRSRKSRRTLRSAAPRVRKSIAYECTPPRSFQTCISESGARIKNAVPSKELGSVATRTHHSPSKRPGLELACSKISTSI